MGRIWYVVVSNILYAILVRRRHKKSRLEQGRPIYTGMASMHEFHDISGRKKGREALTFLWACTRLLMSVVGYLPFFKD